MSGTEDAGGWWLPMNVSSDSATDPSVGSPGVVGSYVSLMVDYHNTDHTKRGGRDKARKNKSGGGNWSPETHPTSGDLSKKDLGRRSRIHKLFQHIAIEVNEHA